MDRLERMRRLLLTGLTTAEAARVSGRPRFGTRGPRRRPASRCEPRTGRPDVAVRRLTDAATALDQLAVESQLRRGDGLAAEHLFTECTRAALSAVGDRTREWDGYPPVLLACVDQEQHSLALNALGAALAEIGCPCRNLGASVPGDALASAARQVAPRALFVWAQVPGVARVADLPAHRPLTPVVVGGPGWRGRTLPASVTCVDSLAAAVGAVARRTVTVPS